MIADDGSRREARGAGADEEEELETGLNNEEEELETGLSNEEEELETGLSNEEEELEELNSPDEEKVLDNKGCVQPCRGSTG